MDLDPWRTAAILDRLADEHEFYIDFDDFGGAENLDLFRRALRRAAGAKGTRVHTRHFGPDDALWVYDPDYEPDPEDMRRRIRAAMEGAALHIRPSDLPNSAASDRPDGAPHPHLRIVD